LKIEKGLEEKSGRYALCALLFAVFRLRESSKICGKRIFNPKALTQHCIVGSLSPKKPEV